MYKVGSNPVQQGEVRIVRVKRIPNDAKLKKVDRSVKGFVISHSESGHHHLVTGGDVMERTDNVPAGMKVFYAILDAPRQFIQDAPHPHGGYDLGPGVWEFRVSREYDPFADQVRRVAD